jgi:hypothetical protein
MTYRILFAINRIKIYSKRYWAACLRGYFGRGLEKKYVKTILSPLFVSTCQQTEHTYISFKTQTTIYQLFTTEKSVKTASTMCQHVSTSINTDKGIKLNKYLIINYLKCYLRDNDLLSSVNRLLTLLTTVNNMSTVARH